jgi:CRP-like cAMP-binding protein
MDANQPVGAALAHYLGLSERHVSRLVKALAARGILRLDKGAEIGIDKGAARMRLEELES